jgi:hypothetical protein
MSHPGQHSVLVNFRADKATLEAIDKLAAAYGGGKSRAIRDVILAAAAKLDEKDDDVSISGNRNQRNRTRRSK